VSGTHSVATLHGRNTANATLTHCLCVPSFSFMSDFIFTKYQPLTPGSYLKPEDVSGTPRTANLLLRMSIGLNALLPKFPKNYIRQLENSRGRHPPSMSSQLLLGATNHPSKDWVPICGWVGNNIVFPPHPTTPSPFQHLSGIIIIIGLRQHTCKDGFVLPLCMPGTPQMPL